jgi:hypothetical protein
MPVMSESSGSTGAHVQKRLVSPYAVVSLVHIHSCRGEVVELTIIQPRNRRPELLVLEVGQGVRGRFSRIWPIPLAGDQVHLTVR